MHSASLLTRCRFGRYCVQQNRFLERLEWALILGIVAIAIPTAASATTPHIWKLQMDCDGVGLTCITQGDSIATIFWPSDTLVDIETGISVMDDPMQKRLHFAYRSPHFLSAQEVSVGADLLKNSDCFPDSCSDPSCRLPLSVEGTGRVIMYEDVANRYEQISFNYGEHVRAQMNCIKSTVTEVRLRNATQTR
jgi:hypothetical protein